ncbi:hypothetical protein FRC10_005831 [Ceratobasidium sp. 414]|nr:hypothetical protein FRC10_005831 [Ceratobasidium sp. 414]
MAAQLGSSSTSYGAQPLLPEWWAVHRASASLIDKRRPVNKILYSIYQYLYAGRDEDWTAAVYGSDQFVSGKAKELDEVLQGFTPITHGTFQSTVTLVEQARAEDRAWMDRFVAGVDRVTPAPGGFAQAYHNKNVNELNTLAAQVLDQQSKILSAPTDLQDEDARNARDLTNWIMNLTGKRPGPSVLLGKRFVGPWEHFRSTTKYDLFRSKFVTGETVVIKALRDKVAGKDSPAQIRKFQEHVEMWHKLRSEHTLPFYGIGKSEQNGLTQIYSVAPYMKNGDAVAYHQNYFVSPAESLQIALDAAYAVRYLHEKRPPVVHFSICTENILIDDQGRGILAGFGLLELVGDNKPFGDTNDFQAATLASTGQLPKRKNYRRIEEISDPEAFWQLLEHCWAQDETQRPDMDEVVIRLRRLSRFDEPPKSVHIRGDLPSVDGTLEYGRIAPPVVQGPQPRRR